MNTLTFWQTLSLYHIQIPELQRDYAQGRGDVKSIDIRDKFLNELSKSLTNQKPIHLDFIYGTVEKGEGFGCTYFVPVDGQQRLTTLFLLHYYFSPCDEEATQMLSKFSYATRPSSAAFCAKLVVHKMSHNLAPSEEIKDALWYEPEWNYDPTVQGMLVMLDVIHTKFEKHPNGWQQLTNQPIITFDFLNMKEYNLSTELYIKMNSRGKLLTNWENFKADLEKYVELEPKITLDSKWADTTVAKKDWKELMDTDWTDIFWSNRDKENDLVDEEWIRFFKGIALICFARDTGTIAKSEHNDLLRKFAKTGDEYLSISDFEQIGLLTKPNLEYVFDCLELIRGNRLRNVNPVVDKLQMKVEGKPFDIFKRNIGGSAGLRSRLFLFAFFEGVRNTRQSDEKFDTSAFLSWMRIWRNLLSNTEYGNNETRFCNAIHSIHLVSNQWKNGKDLVKTFLELGTKLTGFDDQALQEEVLKLEILSKDPARFQELEAMFLEAENNEVLQGRIGFLLDISKNGDSVDFDLLENYISRFNTVFSISALSGRSEKLPEYLLHRAMLSRYDYSCEIRWGTVFNYGYGNRDIWIRILYQKENYQKVKLFLDEIDVQNVETSLARLIDNYTQFDYRYFLVRNPSIFGSTHINQIWWKTWKENPNNPGEYINLELVLMSKDWLSGANWEFFTFCLFKEYQTKVKPNDEIFRGLGEALWEINNYYREKEDGGQSYVYWEVLHSLHLVVYYKPEYYPNKCFKLVIKEVTDGGRSLFSSLALNAYELETADVEVNRLGYFKIFTYSELWVELKKIAAAVVGLQQKEPADAQ